MPQLSSSPGPSIYSDDRSRVGIASSEKRSRRVGGFEEGFFGQQGLLPRGRRTAEEEAKGEVRKGAKRVAVRKTVIHRA